MTAHVLMAVLLFTALFASPVLHAQTKLYWSTQSSTIDGMPAIQRANLDGTGAENLLTFANATTGDIALDVSAGTIYCVIISDTSSIVRVNMDGTGEVVAVNLGLSSPQAIALDLIGRKIYWSSQPTEMQSAGIFRSNLDFTNVERIIDAFDPYGIALDGTRIIWYDNSTGVISSANLDGSDPQFAIEEASGQESFLALDAAVADKLYWTSFGNEDRMISRANLDGTDLQQIVTGFGNPHRLALDLANQMLYWSDPGGVGIVRSGLEGNLNEGSIEVPILGLTSVEAVAVDGTNRAPISNAIPDTSLLLGENEIVLNLDFFFSDPDADLLTYSALSLNESIVTAAVDGPELFVRPIAAGATSINVTAHEARGGSATVGFDVAVFEAETNSPPTLTRAIPDTITTVDGPIITLNLDDFFFDPDGDPLFFSSISSNENVAIATIRQDSLLRVVPLAVGSASISVFAQDLLGGLDSTHFGITITPGAPQPVVKVYWTDRTNRSLHRANSDGTNLENLVTNLTNGPVHAALDLAGGKMYWTDDLSTSPFRIQRANLDGTDPDTLVSINGLVIVGSISLDTENGKMYWTEVPTFAPTSAPARQSGVIMRANLDGTAIELFLDELFFPTGVAVGGGYVYWHDGSLGQIQRARLDATVDTTFIIEEASFQETSLALDVAGGTIYWTAEGSIFGAALNSIVTEEVVFNAGFVSALTLDPSHGKIYWALPPEEPGMFRANLDGTHRERLSIPGLSSIYGVGVDGSNRPPMLRAGPIPDTTLALDGEELILDLAAIFVDPDGDALSFQTSSSNESTVTASVDGPELFLRPVAGGNALIAVTASEVRGGAITDTFNVTVTSNAAPFVLNQIPDVTLVATDALVINLKNVFADPNPEDRLAYDANPSDTSVVSTNVAGNFLTVSPKRSGQTVITVSAKDPLNAAAQDTFEVAVVGSAAPPLVVNVIPDTALILGRNLFCRNLDAPPKVFQPAGQGERLLYTEASSNQNVAEARILSDDTLCVTPVGPGFSLITVTATNGQGGLASTRFVVTVYLSRPPVISHSVPRPQDFNTEIIIVTDVSDDLDTVLVDSLYYRIAGDSAFFKVQMQFDGYGGGGSRFIANIPNSAVTSRGVEYYIIAADQDTVPSKSRAPATGVYSISVRVADPGLATSVPVGNHQTDFRLISVPINMVNPDALAILSDDLGQYDRKQWRLFEWLGGEPPQEAEPPNSSIAMLPGKAVWLVSRKGGAVDTGPGEGQSVSTSQPYAIPLHPDWNLVANPFNFPIPVRNLRLNRQDVVDPDSLELISFSGQWDTSAVLMLQPFQGYALEVERSDTLYVDPRLYPAPRALPKSSSPVAPISWSIRILAQARDAFDLGTVLGISPASSHEWDRMDRPKPPGIGEYVSVYFSRPEWKRRSTKFHTDFRPALSNIEEWNFEVATTVRDEVRLEFLGIESVPIEYEIWLIDPALRLSRNLRESSVYSVAGRGPEYPKRLILVMSQQDEFEAKYSEYRKLPATFELSQNFPNPFNPATTIRYGLPKAERVAMQIFDVLGREVMTLVNDEQKEAGYHLAIWNGRNGLGQPVGNGVYFIRMRAGNFVETRKMVMVE